MTVSHNIHLFRPICICFAIVVSLSPNSLIDGLHANVYAPTTKYLHRDFTNCVFVEHNKYKTSRKNVSFAPKPLGLLLGSSAPYLTEALFANSVLAAGLVAVGQRSLTSLGLVNAYALGVGLWTFLDFNGWIVCVAYFVLGSAVTKVKMAEKEKLGIAEKREGRRGPENVWGSAATAMMCALGSYLYPQYAALLKIGYVSSIASKLSDTFGSEIGKAFGKTTYLITSLKLVPRGTEGAVSIEGTVAGVVASIIISAVAFAAGILQSTTAAALCVLAAFFATTAESYIGAIFQDNYPWLTNELVNLLMTVIGAATAIAAATLLLP